MAHVHARQWEVDVQGGRVHCLTQQPRWLFMYSCKTFNAIVLAQATHTQVLHRSHSYKHASHDHHNTPYYGVVCRHTGPNHAPSLM